MDIVMRHIFKKNGILVFAMLAVFFGLKIFSIVNMEEVRQEDIYLRKWILQMQDMDREEREVYVNGLRDEVYGSESGDGEAAAQLSQLYAINKNLEKVSYLIDFSKNGEGIVIDLPLNYLEMVDFYARMEYPEPIYEESLDTYFSLQEYNIVPFITFLLCVVIFANQYETQVYIYALTTKNGKIYNKRMKYMLFALCFAIFVCNEVFDAGYSGIIFDRQLLEASVQSYRSFVHAQIDTSIGMVLFMSLISKSLGVFILCQIAELLAIKMKNIKDSMIGGMFFFLFGYLLTTAFEDSSFYSCIQVGIVDWKNIISEISYCIPLHMSYFAVGLLISCVIAVGSVLVMKWEHKNI